MADAPASRVPGGGINREIQLAGRPHQPQQPQTVVVENSQRRSGGTDCFILDIRKARQRIGDAARGQLHVQRVNGKVPAQRVLFERGAQRDAPGPVAAAPSVGLAAKGGVFGLTPLPAVFDAHDQRPQRRRGRDHPQAGPPAQPLEDNLRGSGTAQVHVVGRKPHQPIPDPSAHRVERPALRFKNPRQRAQPVGRGVSHRTFTSSRRFFIISHFGAASIYLHTKNGTSDIRTNGKPRDPF
jgi:hypothetical protein